MTLAVCSVNIISRGKGRSAVAAAAYRSGQAFQNEQDGCFHDYTRKKGVVHSEILVPQNAPDWMRDRPQLWNGAEGAEVRHDARLARDVVIALQQELTREQNIKLAISYAQTFVQQGMIADLSIHDAGDGNPHAHIMLTTREVDGDGFSKKKNREWDSKDSLIKWRQEYERVTNEYLERYGHKERIDVRSYVEQGIDRIPSLHLGPAAHQMEKKGIRTRIGNRNREIEEQNKKIEEISKQVDGCKEEAEKLKNEIAQEEKQRQEKIEKQSAEAQKISEPEPESTHHNRLLEHYVRVARSIHGTTEALQDILTEKGIQDFTYREKTVETVREPVPQQAQEPETPSYHTRVEESEQKRQKQQEYDALYDAAKQKRKEHRLVREPEQQNRRYQSAYERAEERERKISRIEQTTDHRRPEPPKPERQPDFQEQYRIAERRHHELEKQKRRYSRSCDDPEHEK